MEELVITDSIGEGRVKVKKLMQEIEEADTEQHLDDLYNSLDEVALIAYSELAIETFLKKRVKGGKVIAALINAIFFMRYNEQYCSRDIENLFKHLSDDDIKKIDVLAPNGFKENEVKALLGEIYLINETATAIALHKKKETSIKGSVVSAIIAIITKSEELVTKEEVVNNVFPKLTRALAKKDGWFVSQFSVIDNVSSDTVKVFVLREKDIININLLCIVIADGKLLKIETDRDEPYLKSVIND